MKKFLVIYFVLMSMLTLGMVFLFFYYKQESKRSQQEIRRLEQEIDYNQQRIQDLLIKPEKDAKRVNPEELRRQSEELKKMMEKPNLTPEDIESINKELDRLRLATEKYIKETR